MPWMLHYAEPHAVGENYAIICSVCKTASVSLPTQFYTLFSLSSASKPNKPHYISHAQCGIFVYHIKYSIGFTPYLQEVKQALPHLKPGYKLEISVFSGENTLHSLQDPLSEREMMSI